MAKQRHNGTTVQRYNGTTVQRYNGTTVQRYNGTTGIITIPSISHFLFRLSMPTQMLKVKNNIYINYSELCFLKIETSKTPYLRGAVFIA